LRLFANKGNTGGFTLAELIVAFSVGLIVLGATTALLLFGMNMTQRTTQRALEEQIVDGIAEFVKSRLVFASSMEGKSDSDLMHPGAAEGFTDILYVGSASDEAAERGMLFYSDVANGTAPVNVMGAKYYAGHTMSLHARVIQRAGVKPVVSVRIRLFDRDGQPVTERIGTYTLLNGGTSAASATDVEVESPSYFCLK
jgi:hypothetical protein